MPWSAVSFLAAWSVSAQTPVTPVRLRESADPPATLVQVYADGQPRFVALLLDVSGLYIAPYAARSARKLEGAVEGGPRFVLTVISGDALTQLALLRGPSVRGSGARPVTEPTDASSREVLRTVGPGGQFTAQVVGGRKLGVVTSTRRLVPLREVRLESGQGALGDVLFLKGTELHGALVTVLNGSIENTAKVLDQRQNQSLNNLNAQYDRYGPNALTVGYLPSSDLLRRVVRGFLSPDHRVRYPVLGVVCRDAMRGGAEVVEVTPGSAADRAGLRAGDVLERLDRFSVGDQYDFASVMFGFEPGQKILVRYSRLGQPATVEVTVGAVTYDVSMR